MYMAQNSLVAVILCNTSEVALRLVSASAGSPAGITRSGSLGVVAV